MLIRFLFLLFFPLLIFTNPKCVVFDFGGVLAKSDRNKLSLYIQNTLQLNDQDLEKLFLESRQYTNKVFDEKFWSEYTKENALELPCNWMSSLETVCLVEIPGMRKLASDLTMQGYQTAILSNISRMQAEIVKKNGYYDWFDQVFLSYAIGLEKPNPEVYDFLLKALQLQPEEILFIDDKKENVQAAIDVGIDSILFSSLNQLREELEKRNINL